VFALSQDKALMSLTKFVEIYKWGLHKRRCLECRMEKYKDSCCFSGNTTV